MTMTALGAKRKKMHEKAAKKLPELMRLHNYRCFWCHRPLVVRRLLNAAMIFRETADYIYWYQDHEEHMRLKATVEHLTPLSEGGDNDMENLRPACGSCNRTRNNKDPEKFAKRIQALRAEVSKNYRNVRKSNP